MDAMTVEEVADYLREKDGKKAKEEAAKKAEEDAKNAEEAEKKK